MLLAPIPETDRDAAGVECYLKVTDRDASASAASDSATVQTARTPLLTLDTLDDDGGGGGGVDDPLTTQRSVHPFSEADADAFE